MPVDWRRGPYGVPEGYVPGAPLWRRPVNWTGRVRPTPVPMPQYTSGGGPFLQMTPAWYRPVVPGAGTPVTQLQTAVPQRELQMTPGWYRPAATMQTPARSPGGFQGAGGMVRQVVGAVAPYGQAYTQAAREAAGAGMLGAGVAGGGAAGGAAGGAGGKYVPAPRGVPAGWYRQFQEEHGETPEAFYGRQGETLDEAWADKEWGDEFARQYGRAPSESEWEEHWYQTRTGHGRPVFSGEQWDVIRRMERGRRGGGGEQEVRPRVIPNPVRWRTWGG